jgi:TrmH family RNA methyltransferase
VSDAPLGNVCVVLHEPQDPVNIAAAIRAMKNMGVARLRLVNPVSYDAGRIQRVAHGTTDVVEQIEHFESLDAALADCVRVAGFTARRRAAKRPVVDPQDAARDLLGHAAHGTAALLFGREDRGLPNEALDRAHVVVIIPTTGYASLNLAQAVLIALYELHRAAPGTGRAIAPPRKDAPPATAEQYELLFSDVERALGALNFFKTRYAELVMRTVRSLTYRAAPDAREIQLVRAMSIEVLRTIDRVRAGGT